MKLGEKLFRIALILRKKEHDKEQELLKAIKQLENDNILNNVLLEKKKLELLKIREKKMEGVMIRSKAQWIKEGEKTSKYFCQLENKNFISKTMARLISNDKREVDNQIYILNETRSFYKTLYSHRLIKRVNLENLLSTFNIKKLSNNQKEQLEGTLTYQEILTSLKKMQNNKSPGHSGFSVEFYKFFWCNIGQFLVRSLNKGLQKGELSTT